eukprot:CAMPEP_0182567450 /NCGR_PEP_ID=MMETSP1324-20130603/8676_1 /TAXON_ID=236786 /ORGANISM="Florenciella sp., Strain RCC1587" /LENGTH=75 /DNA_ID=CAMNT_0024781453 /DNA_START=277 /DNA_END=501 /DNA_ORIENTATION=-
MRSCEPGGVVRNGFDDDDVVKGTVSFGVDVPQSDRAQSMHELRPCSAASFASSSAITVVSSPVSAVFACFSASSS